MAGSGHIWVAGEPDYDPTPWRDRRGLVSGPRVDGLVLDIGSRQHSAVATRQLLAAGVGAGAIKHRVGRGWLHPIFRGVLAIGRPDLTRRGMWMSATLTLPPGTLLSHRANAYVRGHLPYRPGPIDITYARRAHGQEGVRVHRARSLRPADYDAVDRIPVTGVGRLIVDLAATEPAGVVRDAFEEADRLGDLSMSDVRECRRLAGGRPGAGLIHELVGAALAPDYPISKLEARFARFRRDSGLPEPLTNVFVLGFETDVFWPGPPLAVELDSWRHHGSRAAFERDRERDVAFQRAGIPLIRITWSRLANHPAAVLADLKALLDPA